MKTLLIGFILLMSATSFAAGMFKIEGKVVGFDAEKQMIEIETKKNTFRIYQIPSKEINRLKGLKQASVHAPVEWIQYKYKDRFYKIVK
jgi:hypothetical protein